MLYSEKELNLKGEIIMNIPTKITTKEGTVLVLSLRPQEIVDLRRNVNLFGDMIPKEIASGAIEGCTTCLYEDIGDWHPDDSYLWVRGDWGDGWNYKVFTVPSLKIGPTLHDVWELSSREFSRFPKSRWTDIEENIVFLAYNAIKEIKVGGLPQETEEEWEAGIEFYIPDEGMKEYTREAYEAKWQDYGSLKGKILEIGENRNYCVDRSVRDFFTLKIEGYDKEVVVWDRLRTDFSVGAMFQEMGRHFNDGFSVSELNAQA